MSPLDGKRVLLYRGATDFRLGINGLTRLVGRPSEGFAYVFCSKSGSSLKVLWYERSSVWLAQARLGAGRFQFPSGDKGKIGNAILGKIAFTNFGDFYFIPIGYFYLIRNIYDTFYGSITDLSYCVKGIEQFLLAIGKDAKSVGYDFIMDRGYFSAASLSALSAKGLSFACMGKSNAVFRALVRDFGAQAKSAASLIGMGSYGMRLEGKAFDSGNENAYHLYLYFDSLKQTQEKAGVESKLIEAKKALEGKRTDKGGGLKRTYGRYLAIEETKSGRIKSVRVNAESVDAMLAEAGFFWVASTMEMEPSEMIGAYRARGRSARRRRSPS